MVARNAAQPQHHATTRTPHDVVITGHTPPYALVTSQGGKRPRPPGRPDSNRAVRVGHYQATTMAADHHAGTTTSRTAAVD
jgi:hypothetical protein